MVRWTRGISLRSRLWKQGAGLSEVTMAAALTWARGHDYKAAMARTNVVFAALEVATGKRSSATAFKNPAVGRRRGFSDLHDSVQWRLFSEPGKGFTSSSTKPQHPQEERGIGSRRTPMCNFTSRRTARVLAQSGRGIGSIYCRGSRLSGASSHKASNSSREHIDAYISKGHYNDKVETFALDQEKKVRQRPIQKPPRITQL